MIDGGNENASQREFLKSGCLIADNCRRVQFDEIENPSASHAQWTPSTDDPFNRDLMV